MARYNNSPALLLMKEFPHHDWHPWRFNRSPRGWWRAIAQQFKENDPSAVEMVRKYINYLSEKYNIRTLNDWHFFAPTGSAAFHLATLGSLPEVLQRLYPDHDWHFDKPNVLSGKPFLSLTIGNSLKNMYLYSTSSAVKAHRTSWGDPRMAQS